MDPLACVCVMRNDGDVLGCRIGWKGCGGKGKGGMGLSDRVGEKMGWVRKERKDREA